MANTTENTRAFIESEVYSSMILTNLHDGLLPETFYRNVSDFNKGDVLNIKTIGTATITEVAENQPIVYAPIDTGQVQLRVTDYVGTGWYITDILRADGSQIDQLSAAHAMEATRAIQENFETRLFQTANDAQTPGDLNLVNGQAHRFIGSGTNGAITIEDFARMQLAFDKANVPVGGRIAIVDPSAAYTLNLLVGAQAFNHNPHFEGLVRTGFARDHRFVAEIYGWSIWTSNRLPQIASETIDSKTVTGGVANIFASVVDDNTRPLMVAWRQMPKTEGGRNKDLKRDEFDVTARYAVGVQRTDSLGIIITKV